LLRKALLSDPPGQIMRRQLAKFLLNITMERVSLFKFFGDHINFDLFEKSRQNLNCAVLVVYFFQIGAADVDLVTHLPLDEQKLLLI
jgi:hypothetical protein